MYTFSKKIAPVFAAAAVCAFGISSAQALACTYVIDEEAAKKDLTLAILKELDVSSDAVNSVEVKSFRYFESKPTPMCPEEMTYVAEIFVSFTNVNDPLTKGCSASGTVTKVEPWDGEKESTYQVEWQTPPSCLE